MYPWLQQAIDAGAEVVTASRRLSRELRANYDLAQLEDGRSAWLTPPIHPVHTWLTRLAVAASVNGPLRLGSAASTILWERCLASHVRDDVLSTRSVVNQAVHTWQRMQEWLVPAQRVVQSARSRDERWFAMALEDYCGLLTENDWEDAAMLTARVTRLVRDGVIALPAKVVHAGFDRVPPATESLFEELRSAGCEVQGAGQVNAGPSILAGAYDTADAELRAAGAWARSHLLKHPAWSIAIVSTTLEADADRTTRLIREGLAPGWQFGSSEHRNAVDVSYGRRLSEYPAIAIALLALRWLHTGLTSRDVSQLLRSGYIGLADVVGRSRLELVLRKMPDRTWTVPALCSALSGWDRSADATDWLRRVECIGEVSGQASSAASPADLAAQIDRLLGDLGWPGERTLSSEEFQLVNRWRDLLNEFAATGVVVPRMDLAAAVRRISSMAAETIFQPEGHDSRIRALGPLEAAGMSFDALWIAGLDARQWPPPGNPSSLMSRELQREFGMPDATPADTLDYARRVLGRLVSSAGTAVLSRARFDGESEVPPSALLDQVDATPLGQVDPGWHAATLIGDADAITTIDEPPPATDGNEKIAGGAYTVARHGSEPFQSFAFGLLRVSRLHRFEPGLSARIRGNIVHAALSRLYAKLPTQEQIRAWSGEELQRRIGSSIDAALGDEVRQPDAVLSRLISLERRRLRQMLQGFVASEAARPEFAVIAVEEELAFERNGVCIDLRIDRLDRIADGTVLVSDYKTGRAKSLLTRDRDIANLQLIVYSSALEDAVGGVALINIDSREISVKAMTGSEDWGRDYSEDWEARLASWQREVDDAISGIAAGEVHVNVAIPAADARPLAILSRVEELRRAD